MMLMRARAIGLEVVGGSGGEELVICPFHDDSHASACWNPKSDLFYCFTCGLGMNLEQLLARTGNKVDSEAFYEEWTIPPKLDLSRDVDRLDVGTHGYSGYLKRRGITAEVMDDYGVMWGDEASGGERIIFPSRNTYGKTEGIICRYVHHGIGPRYRKTGKQFPIWPMDYLVGTVTGEYILVTEGLFSCLRVASVDKRFRTVSIAGAKANAGIVAALSPFNPIFLYDRDKAGIRAAKEMKKLRPDWLVMTAKVAPDDMLEDQQISRLIDKVFDRVQAFTGLDF
jgi:hypothetical protein